MHPPGVSSSCISCFLLAISALAQVPSPEAKTAWQHVQGVSRASLRGLSIANDGLIWATGTAGALVYSTDGGGNWRVDSVAGATALDFRDVHVVDARTVYLMSAGTGASSRIYKTSDGGRNWKLQFAMQDSAGFLDGFEFWDAQHGIAFGDPLQERLYLITTADGGNTWQRIAPENIPPIIQGEYAFAASGTSIAVQGKTHVWIGTGGAAARVFHSKNGGKNWTVATTPMPSGSESAGIFSLAFYDKQTGIAVGGDFRKPNEVLGSIARTQDGGQTWTLVEGAPLEFRSCVRFIPRTNGMMLVAVGTSGADYSRDGGITWMEIGNDGFNTLGVGSSGENIWAAGAEGKIAKLIIK